MVFEHSQRLLADSLVVSASAHPDRDAIITVERRYSYSELLDASLRLARLLRENGIERGDRVAIFLENGFPAAVSIFGTLLAGGVFMVISDKTKSDKLRFMLEDSGARWIVTEERLASIVRPAIEGLAIIAITRLEEAVRASRPDRVEHGAIPNDLASLIYTSGSTGQPKGVMMTHQSMVFTAQSLIDYLRLEPAFKIMNVLPLSFDYGLYQLLMSVRLGATLVLEKSFAYAGEIVRRIRSEEIDVFPGVPTVFQMLLGLDDRRAMTLPSVKRVTNTAASLPPSIVPRLERIFPSALIYKMYGLTECKRVSYLEPELLHTKGTSVGRAIPGTEAFILSADGRPAKANEIGILHVRGPHVMLGYWNRPDESARMLLPGRLPGERVLCTQDFFEMDADGFLYFVGRSDDIIKCRGEKVSPVEVENALMSIPGVREAAVVGVADDVLGQKIRAYVAANPEAQLDEHSIKRSCAALIEPFMIPSEVVFMDELPKTTSGKITKKTLMSA